MQRKFPTFTHAAKVCALGRQARRRETGELFECAPRVAQVGDCVRAATITTAIYQGCHAALDS
jgi:hypothetical protein